jgi:hypothetical protein
MVVDCRYCMMDGACCASLALCYRYCSKETCNLPFIWSTRAVTAATSIFRSDMGAPYGRRYCIMRCGSRQTRSIALDMGGGWK